MPKWKLDTVPSSEDGGWAARESDAGVIASGDRKPEVVRAAGDFGDPPRVIYFVSRAYAVDPPVTATREIEWLLERALTRLPDIEEATVFAELVDDTLKRIVIEVATSPNDSIGA